jgi:invasion protein IalB
MRFCFKFSERKLTIAGSTVLCLLGFGHEALAQTAQPKGQAAPVNAPADAAGQPSQPQPNWIVSCNQTRPGLECRAGQSLFLKRTRQRVLSVAVRMPADTKKPNFLMQLPLGVYLPAGATLQIGKEEVKTLPYTSCDQGGCIAEYAVTDAELASIAKGADITISAQGSISRKPFTLTVPALGFAAAYAKIK